MWKIEKIEQKNIGKRGLIIQKLTHDHKIHPGKGKSFAWYGKKIYGRVTGKI